METKTSKIAIQVKALIAQALGIEPADVEETSLLREDLGIDATELPILIEAIRREFNCDITPEEVSESKTVGEFIDLVELYVQ